eukprot:scaffold15093_cov114-Isochrysis_galbana.AAC.8
MATHSITAEETGEGFVCGASPARAPCSVGVGGRAKSRGLYGRCERQKTVGTHRLSAVRRRVRVGKRMEARAVVDEN